MAVTGTNIWAPPVVDMEDPEASKTMAKGCKEFGFFVVENHGIAEETIREVFKHVKALFALPLKDKMALLVDKNQRGYTPMHNDTLDPEHQTKPDTKEGFYVYKERDEGSEDNDKPMRGPNQWPSEQQLPGWKEAMIDYFESMNTLGFRIVRLLAVGLNLDREFFAGSCSETMHAMKMLRYSDEASDPGNGVFGTGAHTDFGLLTMLATDDVPGLQVKLDGNWLDVPPMPGAFICNLGDMLQRWTNDYLPSTLHRVVKQGRERYSIPYFFETDFETEVVCLPQFCSEDNPARYPPTTSGQHLVDMYRHTHNNWSKEATQDKDAR